MRNEERTDSGWKGGIGHRGGNILTHAVLFSLYFLFSLSPLAAEETGFDLALGRYYMSVTPKVLEDGVQTDLSFGLFYTDAMKLAGEIRFRSVKTSGNGEVWEIADSLATRDNQVYEAFLLPLNWHFFRKAGFTLRAGGGAVLQLQ